MPKQSSRNPEAKSVLSECGEAFAAWWADNSNGFRRDALTVPMTAAWEAFRSGWHGRSPTSSESGRPDWIWSLEQPEVSGMRWIETWDANALELGVRRFTVGDTLPPNVACWRYVEPPKVTTGDERGQSK